MMDDSSQVNSTDIPVLAKYNISCFGGGISIFISLRQNFVIPYAFMAVGSVLCSLTAVVGNTIILLALRRSKSLLPASKALFYNLAISDLAVGLVAQPLFTTYLLAVSCDNPRVFCAVGLPYSLVSSFLGYASLWTLTVIALDRYLALHLGIRYKAVVRVKRVVPVLVLGWLLVTFYTASVILSVTLRMILSNLLLLTCLTLSLYFYVKNYFTLRKHKLQTQAQSSFHMAHYRKSLNSMFSIFCLFLITFLPLLFVLVVATVSGFNSLTLFLLDLTSLITMLNSSLNPAVYCWRIRDLKLEALHILRRFLFCFPITWSRMGRVTPLNT